jgi:hypothetical protein
VSKVATLKNIEKQRVKYWNAAKTRAGALTLGLKVAQHNIIIPSRAHV